MNISRRRALSFIAGAPALLRYRSLAQDAGVHAAVRGQDHSTEDASPQLEVAPGPFQGTRESLRQWQVPDWYRDAKFGIWAHWGPQSAIGDGDWYARNMYVQGSKQYEYHVKTYGTSLIPITY
jgi:alpha-L-fucosidase